VVVNPEAMAAELRFTAYGAEGLPLRVAGVENPAIRKVAPGGQAQVMEEELFGKIAAAARRPGWIGMESSLPGIVAYGIGFNDNLTVLDGVNLASGGGKALVVPEIEEKGYTRLALWNPGRSGAAVRVDLVRADGRVRASAVREIGPGMAAETDLRAELYADIEPGATDYVRVLSAEDVGAVAFLGRASRQVRMLAAQGEDKGGTVLYCPHYVAGGQWRTRLSVVNLEGEAGIVTLRFVPDDSRQDVVSRTLPIAPYGKVGIEDGEFFGKAPAGGMLEGWVEIDGGGLRLAGSAAYSDPQRLKFAAALPLAASPAARMVFIQAASGERYFTELVVQNPGGPEATVTVELYDADGGREGTASVRIEGRRRLKKTLLELFPSLKGRNGTSGYLKVSAERPITAFLLTGTHDLSVLSAVLPQ